MKVSVIVPCYKVEKHLPTCIESIQHQSYSDWELILVDDGSPDHCGEICDEYAKKDNRIRVIHKPNGGLSDARNTGLDAMKGEYVTFLDSDDFWHVDYLKILMGFIIENDAEIAQCSFVRGEDTTFPMIDTKVNVRYYDNHSVFKEQAAKIIMWGKIFKASFFNNIRMPIGKIHEDDWTTWKLYYQARKIAITSQPLYYYTVNPNSIMGQNKKEPDFLYFGAYDERIKFFTATKEEDLEHCSRMQLCKSMVLSYSNPYLSADEKKMVKSHFDENYAVISSSMYIPITFKILFCLFHHLPMMASKIAQKLR